jgi:threonine aldolase
VTYQYSFFNDYSEGAHPAILELMTKTNFEQEDGYGNDRSSLAAAELLKKLTENPDAALHFVSGGTQANLIALASMLKPYESVIAAKTAHINVHEAGAIEATGHKIHTVETPDGKLKADQIQGIVDEHTDEHMVKPQVVFISNSTEMGTAYKKNELESLSRVCRENGLYLYLDGARLGSALVSKGSDVTLPDLSSLVNVFYIGGTKNGALIGETIVINSHELQAGFRYHLKQRGALLAKGRLLSLQFLALFTDGLYFELARHANAMAEKLSLGISAQGFPFLTYSTTNQIFPILPNILIGKLQKQYGFYIWAKTDAEHSAVRLVTSWATREEKVDEFLSVVNKLAGPGQTFGTARNISQ